MPSPFYQLASCAARLKTTILAVLSRYGPEKAPTIERACEDAGLSRRAFYGLTEGKSAPTLDTLRAFTRLGAVVIIRRGEAWAYLEGEAPPPECDPTHERFAPRVQNSAQAQQTAS